jgi:hypothetical protein
MQTMAAVSLAIPDFTRSSVHQLEQASKLLPEVAASGRQDRAFRLNKAGRN